MVAVKSASGASLVLASVGCTCKLTVKSRMPSCSASRRATNNVEQKFWERIKLFIGWTTFGMTPLPETCKFRTW